MRKPELPDWTFMDVAEDAPDSDQGDFERIRNYFADVYHGWFTAQMGNWWDSLSADSDFESNGIPTQAVRDAAWAHTFSIENCGAGQRMPQPALTPPLPFYGPENEDSVHFGYVHQGEFITVASVMVIYNALT